jgi:hypothetical protein
VKTFLSLAIIVWIGTSTAPAAATETDAQYKPGPWHYKSIPCVDTTVAAVTPRLVGGDQTTFTKQDFLASGVYVEFKTALGTNPAAAPGHASVTHYQGTAGNSVMMAEKKGDKVQVCFLGPPAPTVYCDPDQDARGRTYRVYDYRQKQQYNGINSEHDCGGA